MHKHPLHLLAAIAFFGAVDSGTAAVTLTINEFTSTTFTVSVTGTTEKNADTPAGPGASPSLFVITLNGSGTGAFYTGQPTLQSNTLTQMGSPTNAGMTDSSSGKYFLSFSFDQVFPMNAGTALGGSATFTGNFNPAAASPGDFQLWSGYNWFTPNSSFSVFHVNAVPEPSTLALLAFAGLACQRRRR